MPALFSIAVKSPAQSCGNTLQALSYPREAVGLREKREAHSASIGERTGVTEKNKGAFMLMDDGSIGEIKGKAGS